MENVRVAFVGAGAMAKEHARVFGSFGSVELCGIFSRTKERSVALAKEVEVGYVADSIMELYETCSPDLLVVAVSETSIRQVVLECLEYSWNLLLEKPAGLDLEEAREILEKANALNRRVYVGLNRRFMSSSLGAISLLGDSNASRYVTIQDQQSLEDAERFGHPKEVLDRWMYANCIHLVDYANCFCKGKVERVEVIQPWGRDRSCVVLARIVYSSGDIAIYEGLWERPGPWAVSISTEQYRISLRPLEEGEFQRRGERSRNAFAKGDADLQFKPGFLAQAQEVLKGIDGVESQAVTLKESFRSMELVASIYQDADGK